MSLNQKSAWNIYEKTFHRNFFLEKAIETLKILNSLKETIFNLRSLSGRPFILAGKIKLGVGIIHLTRVLLLLLTDFGHKFKCNKI